MANNKVVLANGTTLIDLTSDTVTADKVLSGYNFHLASGETASGSITSKAATTYNVSTSARTIASGTYLSGTQTIRAVTTSNITAGNIKNGIIAKVGDAGSSGRIKNVTGTFTSSSTVSSGQTAATAGQILNGYSAWVDGAEVQGNISSVTHPNPTASINSSTGVVTASHTQSTGYVTGSTTTGTLNLTTQAAQTITPTTANQTISSGKYLTGTQTIKGDANLLPQNIISGVSIFNVAGTAVGDSIPNNYTRVNYIRSSGNAYIDTGIWEMPGGLTRIYSKFDVHSSDERTLFGYQGKSGVTDARLNIRMTTSISLDYYAAATGLANIGTIISSSLFTLNVDLNSDSKYPVFTLYNNSPQTGTKAKTTKVTTSSSKLVNQGNIYLFADNYQGTASTYGNSTYGYVDCYAFQIYYFGGKCCDMIPCVRNSDSVAGFYDIMRGTFFPSIGANRFTYG